MLQTPHSTQLPTTPVTMGLLLSETAAEYVSVMLSGLALHHTALVSKVNVLTF